MAITCNFLVRRDDLGKSEFRETGDSSAIALEAGQVLFAVDAFALTANNVTYGVFGDAMRYWDFFPAPQGWGSIPVWGFAVVERSSHPEVKVGDRYYGYLPMATHLVATASKVSGSGFTEVSPYRADLSPIYNTYMRTAGDAGYDVKRESEQMLFRPLFLTGYLIDDFLADADFFGGRSVVVSSASSKTSIGLAFCLGKHGPERCEVVGLTSRANQTFVESLGCYHRVVTYDDVATLDAKTPSVFVDMAGDANVTSAVHEHFQDNLRYSCSVGGTHWENLAFGKQFPGPTPTLFFAPGQLEKRLGDWGPAELQRRMGQAWISFLPKVDGWITVEKAEGREAIERVWSATVSGKADPKRGYILSY